MISWIAIFVFFFLIMEFVAWTLHKYVMHGPLWALHEDHHNPPIDRKFQRNDLFALFFAIPSFLFILFDRLYQIALLGAAGYGIMAYGIAYFTVHEVLIHRRWKILPPPRHRYFKALNAAHKIHHSIRDKDGCRNFGMLVVSRTYFSKTSIDRSAP